MNWYLAAFFAINLFGLGGVAVKHGEPRDGKYNIFLTFAISIFQIWLVIMAVRCGWPQ